MAISASYLPTWLLERIPDLVPIFAEQTANGYGWTSAYFMLGMVLRPHLLALIERGEISQLERIFDLLEELATEGDASVQNELKVVTLEDMDLWRFWDLLGPKMHEFHVDHMAWFPEWVDRQTRVNAHVDSLRYRTRWVQEITQTGGFRELTPDRIRDIRTRLYREFRIESPPGYWSPP